MLAPRALRDQANSLFEAFILDHINRGVSCAFETTLRSEITFDQAELARRAGFTVEMRYLSLKTFEMHLERIRMRADRRGHSAPESALRRIYEASIENLPRAIREMDFISRL
jgi:predicted ABC-type ATPase